MTSDINPVMSAKTVSLPSPLSSIDALPSGWSPGSLSTDGRDGEGYVPPPAAKAFVKPLYPGNSACFTTDTMKDSFCLPNGTYDAQAGSFNFTSTKTMSASFPKGGSIIVRFVEALTPAVLFDKTSQFTTNQTSNAKSSFAQGMARMQKLSFDVLIPNVKPPPVACFYSQKNYKGDAMCYGLGGGNITDPALQNSASVGIVGGATVTMYPQYYGDTGGLAFTVSVSDVSSIPYGVNGSFDGTIKALWVSDTISYIT